MLMLQKWTTPNRAQKQRKDQFINSKGYGSRGHILDQQGFVRAVAEGSWLLAGIVGLPIRASTLTSRRNKNSCTKTTKHGTVFFGPKRPEH